MSRSIARASLALACGLLLGCPERPAPPAAPTPPAPTATGATGATGTGAPDRREQAKAAAQALGGRLKARLEAALAAEGPAGGIRVCSEEAPGIAAAVAAEQGVALGRTSFRLRNPHNAPPEWARAWVEARVAEPRFQDAPDGGLRALLPIPTAPLCVTCHGPAGDLGPDVRQALAERYPEDQATGFQPGELRGWFWVELPPG